MDNNLKRFEAMKEATLESLKSAGIHREKVDKILKIIEDISGARIGPDDQIGTQFDSLDIIEFAMELEEEFGVEIDENNIDLAATPNSIAAELIKL